MKVENKKKAIMESALELFTSKGFDNTPTAAITKNAGVATGTLFTYFENKLDLINQLYLATKMEYFEVLSDIFKIDVLEDKSALKIWKASVRWGVDNPEKMKFIVQYSSSPYITKLTWAGIDEEMEMAEKLYKKSIEEGKIKDLPIDYLSSITTNMIYSTVLYMISNNMKDDGFIEAVFPMMWDMLKK